MADDFARQLLDALYNPETQPDQPQQQPVKSSQRRIGQESDLPSKIFGGGIRGAATRALFGADPSAEFTPTEMDIYRNVQAMGMAPTPLALASAPAILGRGKKAAEAAKSVYPQANALERARKNAVEMLGLPENNTPEMRAQAMGYIDYLHGTERLDRLLEGKTLDPRRATSGPMPYGTTTPELASSYATSKADTSRRAADEGDIRRYFEVAPKDIGLKGMRSPIPVEMAWHFMSPEQKAKIRELAPRVGHEDLDTFTGKFVVHPEGVNATLNPSHWDWIMKNEAKGNPLTALREMWYSSGQLVDEPEMLGQIYKLAGVDAPISQTKAPWTEAQGVLLGKARITNPIDTSNIEQVSALIEPLKQAFAKDRTKTKAGGPDQWAKESRYTPKTWVSELEKDLAEGKESYVWTSIPDKVTAELRKLGFNGIIDRSGKGGGAKEPVVIPFDPAQVRSRFAAFDPAEMDKPDLLKKKGGPVRISDNPDTMRLELAGGGGIGEERDWRSKIAGGGIRGIITRGLLGMDPPEDMTPTEREFYENAVRASAPAQGLAAAPGALVKGAKGAKAVKATERSAEVQAALSEAKENAKRMAQARKELEAEQASKEYFERPLGYGSQEKVNERAALIKAKESGVLPAAERDANLARMLEQSAVKERLYHATPADFSQFKPGGNEPERSGPAIWMTPDKEFQPAAHNIRRVPDKPNYMYGNSSNMFTPGTNVMPLYSSIKNPLITREKTWKEDFKEFGGSPWTLTTDEVNRIKEAGHDGILYYDKDGKLQEVLAFDPQQVKSAIGNRGTYDVTNPDITKKRGGKVKVTDNLDTMRLAVQKRK